MDESIIFLPIFAVIIICFKESARNGLKKKSVPAAVPDTGEMSMKIKGRDLTNGVPREVTISCSVKLLVAIGRACGCDCRSGQGCTGSHAT